MSAAEVIPRLCLDRSPLLIPPEELTIHCLLCWQSATNVQCQCCDSCVCKSLQRRKIQRGP